MMEELYQSSPSPINNYKTRKKKNNCFQALDNSQQSPAITLAFCLEAFTRNESREEGPRGLSSVTELGKEGLECKEAEASGICGAEYRRGEQTQNSGNLPEGSS